MPLQRFNLMRTKGACEMPYSYHSVDTTATDYLSHDRLTGYFVPTSVYVVASCVGRNALLRASAES